MKTFGLFLIISMLTRNPLLALLIIILIYVFIDRSFIGILPDFMGPFRQRQRVGELKREVQVNPHNANAHLELGELYFTKGQYKQAEEYIKNALVKMEDSALARFYLGASLYHLGHKEEGRNELEESIRLNPKVAQGYPYLYLLKYQQQSKVYNEDNNLKNELVDNLLRYGAVKTFYDAGKYFNHIGVHDLASKFFDEVLDIYRISSPTMRRRFRRMAMYAKLFGRRRGDSIVKN